MNEQEVRKIYKNVTEKETPSAELVSLTLSKMHKELEAIEKEKRRISFFEKMNSYFSRIKTQSRWMLTAGIACTAALCLIVLRPETTLRMNTIIYQEDMRMLNAYRSDAAELILPQWRDRMDRIMQSTGGLKRTSYQFVDFSYDEDAPILWAAIAEYDVPVKMQVTVSNFQPALYEVMESADPNDIEGRTVYLGKDASLGDCFAIWKENDEWFIQVRFVDGIDKDHQIKKGIEEILNLPFESISGNEEEN